jgi:hypothetical protein
MLMVTCGLPKSGSFREVKNIGKHTVLELEEICRYLQKTTNSIVGYYKFGFVI